MKRLLIVMLWAWCLHKSCLYSSFVADINCSCNCQALYQLLDKANEAGRQGTGKLQLQGSEAAGLSNASHNSLHRGHVDRLKDQGEWRVIAADPQWWRFQMQKATLGDACNHLGSKACKQQCEAKIGHTLELVSELPAIFSASILHQSSTLGGWEDWRRATS